MVARKSSAVRTATSADAPAATPDLLSMSKAVQGDLEKQVQAKAIAATEADAKTYDLYRSLALTCVEHRRLFLVEIDGLGKVADLRGTTQAYKTSWSKVQDDVRKAIVGRLTRQGATPEVANATADKRIDTMRKGVSVHIRRELDGLLTADQLTAYGFSYHSAIGKVQTLPKPSTDAPADDAKPQVSSLVAGYITTAQGINPASPLSLISAANDLVRQASEVLVPAGEEEATAQAFSNLIVLVKHIASKHGLQVNGKQ